ncbi:hypothetical protein F4781DRAFT_272506 [Annulohypoxylon bovei var. microspora]|nr:hypothetical protein F4781DRAFT_272506 [Annulohypoxylon bovei var. microspora]
MIQRRWRGGPKVPPNRENDGRPVVVVWAWNHGADLSALLGCLFSLRARTPPNGPLDIGISWPCTVFSGVFFFIGLLFRGGEGVLVVIITSCPHDLEGGHFHLSPSLGNDVRLGKDLWLFTPSHSQHTQNARGNAVD